MANPLTLDVLPEELAVCRLPSAAPLPTWAQAGSLFSLTRTIDELSIVCAASLVPADVDAVSGWRALRVRGPLPFHLTGILASLAQPLAAASVPLFTLSTYDTDYVLVQGQRLDTAIAALRQAGHQVEHTRGTD
jgi:uncharacterized protein